MLAREKLQLLFSGRPVSQPSVSIRALPSCTNNLLRIYVLEDFWTEALSCAFKICKRFIPLFLCLLLFVASFGGEVLAFFYESFWFGFRYVGDETGTVSIVQHVAEEGVISVMPYSVPGHIALRKLLDFGFAR